MEWMEKGGRGKGGGTGEGEMGEEKEKRKETWRKRKRVDRVTRGAWRRECGEGWEDRGNKDEYDGEKRRRRKGKK